MRTFRSAWAGAWRRKSSSATTRSARARSSDIQYATDLARNMVTRWGMSEKLGPLQYESSQDGYLGHGPDHAHHAL